MARSWIIYPNSDISIAWPYSDPVGEHWSCVNGGVGVNLNPLTYVATDTNQQDKYGFTDLPAGAGPIDQLTVYINARMTGIGSPPSSSQIRVLSNLDEYPNMLINLVWVHNQPASTKSDIWVPNGFAYWTPAQINAIEVNYYAYDASGKCTAIIMFGTEIHCREYVPQGLITNDPDGRIL